MVGPLGQTFVEHGDERIHPKPQGPRLSHLVCHSENLEQAQGMGVPKQVQTLLVILEKIKKKPVVGKNKEPSAWVN